MCCFRLRSEHASSSTAIGGHALRQQCGSPINDNRAQMRALRYPAQHVRWRVAVMPTLAIITMIASYFFGIH